MPKRRVAGKSRPAYETRRGIPIFGGNDEDEAGRMGIGSDLMAGLGLGDPVIRLGVTGLFAAGPAV